MDTPNTPEILRGYIRDAAHQRRLMEPWLNDREFIEGGGKVAYAVDTDVIMLFTNPVEESIPQQHRPFGYATIFHDDNKELAIAFGQALAEHIFTKLVPGGGPLMVMPSLEAEIGRVFAAVARDASGSENAAQHEVMKLRATIEELEPFADQPDELAEQLKTRAPALAQILRSVRGPNAVLNRFGRLFSEERIAGLDFLAERNKWYDAEFRALFPAIANIPDLYRLNRLADDWLKTLKKTKDPKTSKDKVEDDAQALARLQWMNEKIDPKKFRIVFITGDKAISEAAARPSKTRSGNFRDLYIRNPRAFMADDCVLFPWDDSESQTHYLTEFLDLFLADFLDRSPRDKCPGAAHHDVLEEREDDLIDTCRSALDRFPDMGKDFRKEWEDFTSDVSTRAISLDLTAEDLAIDADVAGDIDKIIDKVEHILEQQIDKTWSACFDAATQSGFILNSASRGKLPSEPQLRPRNAPPLYFDRFEETTKFVRALLSTTGKENPQEYQKSLDMLKKEDEGTGYLFNLAFAMLFASMGRWQLTAILADRALQKVQESGDEQLSGREAFYLKAITLRHTARKAADLGEIDRLIDSALACLEKDKKNHKGLEVLPLRFEIERTSAELALSLFDILHQRVSHKTLRSLEEIQTAFQDHLEKLSDDLKSRMDPWIYLNVERKLLTNIFMTVLLRVFKYEESFDTETMASLFERFESNINDDNPPEIGISYLVDMVYSVSKIWLELESKAFAEETIRKLSDHAIDDASVMSYDKQRFKFLRGIVERCIKDRSRFREPR